MRRETPLCDPRPLCIRPYAPPDRDGVIALWDDVFADDPPHNEYAAMIDRKLGVQPELFFVACIDDALIGTVMAGFDGVRGWVHRLAVHPDHRRRGVGEELMRVAEVGLADIGCPKLNLQVRTRNAEVIAFYERLGYATDAVVSFGKHLATPRDRR